MLDGITQAELLSQRLHNQLLVNTTHNTPEEVVLWMGAIQAQEYAMTKWAVGLRAKSLVDTDIEDAFNRGTILRTHVLRPTWHFVSPADIRWMLQLTAPRVNQVNAYMYRKMELDVAIFRRAARIIERALRGSRFKTRNELQQELSAEKINADGIRLSCLVMKMELDGLICSGPRKGNQFTYALLEERVSRVKDLSIDEALMNLALRYFTSRGPASARDFSWWSGLTLKDANKAVEVLKHASFKQVLFNGETLIYKPPLLSSATTTFLMPEYDEYGIAYRNREALFDEHMPRGFLKQVPGKRTYMLVIDGLIAGTWNINRKRPFEIAAAIGYNSTKQKVVQVRKAVERLIAFTYCNKAVD